MKFKVHGKDLGYFQTYERECRQQIRAGKLYFSVHELT